MGRSRVRIGSKSGLGCDAGLEKSHDSKECVRNSRQKIFQIIGVLTRQAKPFSHVGGFHGTHILQFGKQSVIRFSCP